jgi:hypothetical protein
VKKPRPGKKPQRAHRRSWSPKTRSKGPGDIAASASELLRERSEYTSVSPADTGGDVDGDWQRAESSGEEAVEILSSRDRRRWRIEQHTEEQAREADEA